MLARSVIEYIIVRMHIKRTVESASIQPFFCFIPDVVCRELGYAAGYPVCCNAYGHHYRNILYTKVSCIGNETTLWDCPHEVLPEDERCTYATAVCRNDTTTPTGNFRRRVYLYSRTELSVTLVYQPGKYLYKS